MCYSVPVSSLSMGYSFLAKLVESSSTCSWEQEGLGPFLAHDDAGRIGSSNWEKKGRVVPTEVLDLIDLKYSRLRQKLLKHMMKLFSGETTWEILSETECYELIDEVCSIEARDEWRSGPTFWYDFCNLCFCLLLPEIDSPNCHDVCAIW